MRVPRVTTRRLMIVVAIVAVLLAAEKTRRRWTYFRRLAAYHAHSEACFRIALISTQRDIEEGERLSKRLSVGEDRLLQAFEPIHRFFDSKPDYEAYLKVMKLPLNTMQLETLKGCIADHARMRREYELAAAHLWLPVAPSPHPQ